MPVPYQIYSNFLFAKAGGQGVPLSGTFELTARCNLDCRTPRRCGGSVRRTSGWRWHGTARKRGRCCSC